MAARAHTRLLAIAAATLALAACSGGDDGARRPAARTAGEGPAARPGEPSPRARAIRGWIAALNAGDYEAAASYFAPGAIVQQVVAVRLRSRAAAVAFNRSLPCRATVARVKAAGATAIAVFDLRPGPGGARGCSGSTRVRFRFARGKFAEWRQLPDVRRPPGTAA